MTDLASRANPNVGDYRTRYPLPIHWFFKPDDQFGMEYFGYIRIVKDILRNMTPRFIYDIGSGDGRMSAEFAQMGIRVHGFDYSERAIQFARIMVPEGSFDVADLTTDAIFPPSSADERPDAIVMIEVLEHVHPKHYPNILKTFRERLAPNGRLIISVPSKDLPLNTRWHYLHFTEQEFSEMLTSNGWAITERIYNYRLSHPAAWALRYLWRIIDNRFWRIHVLTRLIAKWYDRSCNICTKDQKPARFIFVCT